MSPFPLEDESPLEKFSKTKIRPNFKEVHPFGCPAYALDGRIQSGKKAKKWEVCARLAIYLGPSPQHARSVGLVLSLVTGLVSPQFHVKYDDTFSTLRNSVIPVSAWQQLAGITPRKVKIKKGQDPIPQIPVCVNNDIIPPIRLANDENPENINLDPEDDSESVASSTSESESDEVSSDSEDSEAESVAQGLSTRSRSGRESRLPSRYNDFIALPAAVIWEEEELCSIAYAMSASSDPDTMYLHEAMKADDS